MSEIVQAEAIENSGAEPEHHRWQRAARIAGVVALAGCGAAAGMGVALSASSYEATIVGVKADITTKVFPGSDKGLWLHSTFGDLGFTEVDGLPLQVRADPTVDLEPIRAFGKNNEQFITAAKADLQNEKSAMAWHFGARAGLGAVGGAAAAWLALTTGEAMLKNGTNRRQTLRRLGVTLGAGALTCGLVGAYGAASFDADKFQETKTTGLLAKYDVLRNTVSDLNKRDTSLDAINGGIDQINTLLTIRDLIAKPKQPEAEPQNIAVNVLYISDMHLRNMYPFLADVIKKNNINLIVNTGDEALKGTPYDFDINPSYTEAIKKVTNETPMIWVKGNHDSPQNAATMDAIPNVYVLNQQIMQIDGLWIGGVGDPRNYGDSSPAYGDAEAKFERDAMQKLLKDPTTAINESNAFDIFMTHEPPAGQQIIDTLKNRIRVLATGHTHRQNSANDLQKDNGVITTNEGSTGMGGLLDDPATRVPLAYSIQHWSSDCQVISEERIQLSDPTLLSANDGHNSSIVTHYFKPQKIVENRVCGSDLEITDPLSWTQPVENSRSAVLEASGKLPAANSVEAREGSGPHEPLQPTPAASASLSPEKLQSLSTNR